MVRRINLQPGSTMGARTIATVEVSARPEVRGRARCGTVNRLGDGTICVDLPGCRDEADGDPLVALGRLARGPPTRSRASEARPRT